MSNPDPPRIVYCHCAFAQVIPAETKHGVLDRLLESGLEFTCVPDLCEMSARKDRELVDLAQFAESGAVRIAACYPRAVHGLFTAAGAPLPKEGIEIINMRTASVDDVVSALLCEGKPIRETTDTETDTVKTADQEADR